MAQVIVLLRSINLGSRNRISMPELREALADAVYDDVRTYLQSGDVVLTSTASAKKIARDCERVIADRFGLDIDVVVRTRNELAKVVQRNPLGRVVRDPKRYQVSFPAAKPDPKLVRKLEDAAVPPEKLLSIGRDFARPLDVPAIAREAHASRAHFIRSFRKAFGDTSGPRLSRKRSPPGSRSR